MREQLTELSQALARRQQCVWCAVVETRGSTPQKAGAAMLVYPDGRQAGTLGGGCVEAEVKQRALAVLAGGSETSSPPELLTFNLDDNYGWDDGLICGGRMTILADPLLTMPVDDYYSRLHTLVDAGAGGIQVVAMQTAMEVAQGDRWLFDEQGRLLAHRGTLTNPPESVTANLPDLKRRPGPSTHHGFAYLPILPRITLLIVGGGHVGQAVGHLAADADFDVEVLDDRGTYVSSERFPRARRRLVGEIGPTLAEMAPTLGHSHYAIIVTRGHNHDEEALYHLAPTAASYVGMIGSKRKIRLIYEDLLARGISPDALKRVHAPLGFDIGSQTVPEIAISIVAELIAHRNLGHSAPRERVRVAVGSKHEEETVS